MDLEPLEPVIALTQAHYNQEEQGQSVMELSHLGRYVTLSVQ